MGIYRYRRATEYLRNEIVEGELFFSPVLEMNDYYDGFIQRSLDGGVEDYIGNILGKLVQHAKEIIARGTNKTEVQKNLESLSNKDTLEWAYNILNNPEYLENSIKQLRIDFQNPEKLKSNLAIQNKNLDFMRQKIFICCFSKKKLDMSMFGYYSENGKGVMLEYEDFERIVKEVKYVNSLPLVPIFAPFEEFVKLQVFTKLECWSHEEELRAYIYDTDQKNTNHGMKIKSIYLGPRTEAHFFEEIKRWAKDANVALKTPKIQDGKLLWN